MNTDLKDIYSLMENLRVSTTLASVSMQSYGEKLIQIKETASSYTTMYRIGGREEKTE